MGTYDEYKGTQLKVGPCCLTQYNIGDNVEIPDGVYAGHEGLVVIIKGIFVAEFEHITTKWGDTVAMSTILNPHDHVLQAMSHLWRKEILK